MPSRVRCLEGVLITNGFFSDEASTAAVGGPIELINGCVSGNSCNTSPCYQRPVRKFNPRLAGDMVLTPELAIIAITQTQRPTM
jgi:hypothetical protein